MALAARGTRREVLAAQQKTCNRSCELGLGGRAIPMSRTSNSMLLLALLPGLACAFSLLLGPQCKLTALSLRGCALGFAAPQAQAEAEAEVEAEAGAEAGAPPFAEPRAFSDTTHAAQLAHAPAYDLHAV